MSAANLLPANCIERTSSDSKSVKIFSLRLISRGCANSSSRISLQSNDVRAQHSFVARKLSLSASGKAVSVVVSELIAKSVIRKIKRLTYSDDSDVASVRSGFTPRVFADSAIRPAEEAQPDIQLPRMMLTAKSDSIPSMDAVLICKRVKRHSIADNGNRRRCIV